jgi:hypothetical protein
MAVRSAMPFSLTPHDDPTRPTATCGHSDVERSPSLWFTGAGSQRHWVCSECAGRYPVAPPWIDATPEQLARIEEDVEIATIVGVPQPRERATSAHFESVDVPLSTATNIVDVHPSCAETDHWYAITRGGELLRLRVTNEALVEQRFSHVDWGFALDDQCAVAVSPSSRFVVVYQGSGSLGVIVRASDGAVVHRINRGDYREENSKFPLAFFRHDEREHVVCGSDWNRLDVLRLDESTAHAEVVTQRTIAECSEGSKRPEHYLDYFHGSLSVSPNETWIVDAGWIWHPVGVDRAWSLGAWMKNPFESEDGASVVKFRYHDNCWDTPVCWIDDDTPVLWGFGNDDQSMIAAALVYSMREQRLERWFVGPRVRPSRAFPPRSLADSWVFDRWLFAISDEEGTTVWDTASGERIASDPQLKPTRYHRRSRVFVTVGADHLRVSRFVYEP